MHQLITSVTTFVETAYKAHPALVSMGSLYGAGILAWALKDIPKGLWEYFIKHMTTTIHMTSSHIVYHRFLKWLEENNYSKNFRILKLSNGRWGHDNALTISVGYGKHIIWYKWRPLILTLNKSQNNMADGDKEEIILTKFGRSHAIFNELIDNLKKDKDDNLTKIHKYKNDWEYVTSQPIRTLNSVFINNVDLTSLIDKLDTFRKKETEQWYIDHGIPYQLGIMLYGPPGTGKTSLIRAIAGYLKMGIATIKTNTLSDFADIFSGIPENCLCVIEDFDSISAVKSRDGDNTDESENIVNDHDKIKSVLADMNFHSFMKFCADKNIGQSNTEKLFDIWAQAHDNDRKCVPGFDFFKNMMIKYHIHNDSQMTDSNKTFLPSVLISSFSDISSMLNALDGVTNKHGRILIVTTNHPEKIDKAVLRPGRIDIKVEVGYVTKDIFTRYLNSFFPNYTVDWTGKCMQYGITISSLQNDIIVGKTADEIFNLYTERNDVLAE